MTERIFVRGFGCRPNGGGTSADFRYRMVGAIAARVPDDEPKDRQSGAPAIGLDRLEQDPVNLRAPYGTADLCPRIMIDDFFAPVATERAVKGSSLRHSQQWNNSCTPTSGGSPTRNRRGSGAPRSSRLRSNPIRRGWSA